MTSKRQMIRDLQEANADLRDRLAHAQPLAQQAFERQILVACLLEHLAPNGACILPLEIRQRALQEAWGYETMVIDSEADHPMIVRISNKPAPTALPKASPHGA